MCISLSSTTLFWLFLAILSLLQIAHPHSACADPVVSENSNERRGLKFRELRRRPPSMVREVMVLRSPQWDDDFSI
jgi:hypothetical protein